MSTRRALVASLILLSLLLTAAAPAPSPTEGVGQALTWLRAQQQGDGGFSNGFSAGSDLGTTADAMLAIIAGGQDPSTWSPAGASPLDFLANAVQAGNVTNPGAAAKVALAMLAAGKGPHAVAGLDLANPILEGFDAGTGFFGMGPFDSSLAILALTGMHTPLPEGALAGLLAARLPDGAYAFNGDLTPGAGDSNTTALAVQALLAAGRRDDTTASLDYFRAAQNEDDGWTYQKPSAFGEATDANSTALVLQALLASGERPNEWGDALAALSSLQVPSGAFIFNAATSSENSTGNCAGAPGAGRVGPPRSDRPRSRHYPDGDGFRGRRRRHLLRGSAGRFAGLPPERISGRQPVRKRDADASRREGGRGLCQRGRALFSRLDPSATRIHLHFRRTPQLGWLCHHGSVSR